MAYNEAGIKPYGGLRGSETVNHVFHTLGIGLTRSHGNSLVSPDPKSYYLSVILNKSNRPNKIGSSISTQKILYRNCPYHIRIKPIPPKGNLVLSHKNIFPTNFFVPILHHSKFSANTTTVFRRTMALRIHHLRPPVSPPLPSYSAGSPSPWPSKRSTIAGDLPVKMISSKTSRKNEGLRFPVRIRSSLETSGEAVVVVGQVTEVDQDTFWPVVNAAGDKTVVLDMYTQWCGPCKMIAPKIEELAEKHLDVVFLKLDCNEENKMFLSPVMGMSHPLAKELGIKVVPTFKILKQGKIVKEITGAKFDDLVTAMEVIGYRTDY
ncbi:hypothetical protein OSB04_025816 [Centaurea solstitialis]|uniref:Thioredoxin domain-containing protein n=1 Tax=Centaurea solstitialis TaxID=347529 RepID=A0AA38WDG1_9ASTR|nr:hypothetical protein OSB04_025816 [Centaurea solstitialis]